MYTDNFLCLSKGCQDGKRLAGEAALAEAQAMQELAKSLQPQQSSGTGANWIYIAIGILAFIVVVGLILFFLKRKK